MVGHLHSLKCQSIGIGRQVIAQKNRYEMDVVAVYDEKVVVAECKALKGQIVATCHTGCATGFPRFGIG